MTAHAALKLLAAIPKQDRDAMARAHEAAGDFHCAMAGALDAEAELETCHEDDRADWQRQYQSALGAAAVAMQRVPVKWLAILGVEP